MRLYERTAAIEDITHVIAHIALDDPAAARRFYDAVRSESGLRSWRVRGFPQLIFYKPGAERIEIVRVLHGAMDLERELGGPET